MKTGAIIRGCILNEEVKKENELIKERVNEKVDEITKEAKTHMNALLSVFADEMHNKINNLETYKEDLICEFTRKCEKNNSDNQEIIKELESKYLELLKQQENSMEILIKNTQDSIKELMLILFEKFFYKQYQDTENLVSVIKEGLIQLEDAKKVHISLNKELINKITDDEKEKLKEISDSELVFTSHSKESLLLELKSEKNNIEVDFNKQIDKIKDIIYSF